ncbi:hypothetical protein KKF70_07575 [bacterium]|nr:hypothetical protein [bacterium]MBU3930498.1 hypothetical protein [bacterium]
MRIKYKNALTFFFCILVSVSLLFGFSDRFFLTNTAWLKHLITVILVAIIFLKYFRPYISKEVFYYGSLHFLLILYCIFLFFSSFGGIKDLVSFIIYPFFFYIGFYIAGFNDVSSKIIKFLYCLFFLAIGVAVIEKVLGPIRLQNLGLNLIRPGWGQSVSMLLVKNVEDIKYFRVFSIFVDHQSFSAFLVLICFLSALFYKYLSQKKYLFYILVCIGSYFFTFSMTSLIVMLILLFLFVKPKYKYLILFVIIPAVLVIGWYFSHGENFTRILHLGSLKYRMLYFKNAMSQISFSPRNYLVDSKINFSADCLWLWLAFRWGALFPAILLAMFIIPCKFLKKKSNKKIYSIFIVTAVVSMLSNGAFFTSTVNIIFWFLLGLLANDKVYFSLLEIYSGNRLPKKFV